jgi:malonyl CoA-acyl carrier protein transacylase
MNVPRLNGSRRTHGRDELLVITADDQPGLAASARDAAALAAKTDGALREWAAETTRSRSGGRLAVAVVADSCSAMSDKLRHAAERLADTRCTRINDRSGIFFAAQPLHPAGGKVAVLFPGEGSQYPGMLGDLCIRFGAAREAFDRADRAFEDHPRQLLPSQLAFGDVTSERMWEMDSAVELVFTGNAALQAVLSTLRVKPDIVAGHSTGDYSALFTSGAIRVGDESEMVRRMIGLNAVYHEVAGSGLPERRLLAVGVEDPAVIDRVLEAVPGLDLAMDNCPRQRVLCGTSEALAAARERLASHGAIVEELAFRRGYHTEAFRPALPVLQPFFDALPLQSPDIELWSCASAARVPEDLGALRRLALEQWAMPVRFTETVQRLWDDGVRIFIESGPRGNLTAFVKDILRQRPHLAVACDGANRPTMTHLLFALGQLAAHRVPMDLSPLGGAHLPPPPLRPASTEKVGRRAGPIMTLATGWPEMRLSGDTASRVARHAARTDGEPRVATGQPQASGEAVAPPDVPLTAPVAAEARPQDARAELMTTHLAMVRRMAQAHERVLLTFLTGGAAAQAVKAPVRLLTGARVHRDADSMVAAVRLSLESHPFLAHHTLGGPASIVDPTLTGLPVMPLTMTLELAAEAAVALVAGHVCIGFENVMARRWIALEAYEYADVEVTALRRTSGPGGVTMVAVRVGAAGAEAYFSAEVRLARSYPSAPARTFDPPATGSAWDRERIYRDAMFHGRLFRGIERVTRIDDNGADSVIEVLGRHGLLASGEATFAIDPVLLDQPGQVVGVWTAERLTHGFVIFPTRLARLDLFSAPLATGSRVACHAKIRLVGEAGVMSDLEVDDGAGRLHARFTGWEDKRFDVPASFLAFMLDTRRSSLCRPWAAGAAASAGGQPWPGARVVRSDIPTGFGARGGIWQQVLAGLTLSRRERETWNRSIASSADAAQWLLGRLAAKDAVRRLLAERGPAIPPADIVISGGTSGRVRATGEWESVTGAPVDVTVDLVNGDTVATVDAGGLRSAAHSGASSAIPTMRSAI